MQGNMCQEEVPFLYFISQGRTRYAFIAKNAVRFIVFYQIKEADWVPVL
jgi:hypothetical protein